jgi:hypothetical protein
MLQLVGRKLVVDEIGFTLWRSEIKTRRRKAKPDVRKQNPTSESKPRRCRKAKPDVGKQNPTSESKPRRRRKAKPDVGKQTPTSDFNSRHCPLQGTSTIIRPYEWPVGYLAGFATLSTCLLCNDLLPTSCARGVGSAHLVERQGHVGVMLNELAVVTGQPEKPTHFFLILRLRPIADRRCLVFLCVDSVT